MDRKIISDYLGYTIRETAFTLPGSFYRGKVRDTYKIEPYLILVASDRISAFDHILKQTIPFKGQVLNRLAGYFFSTTRDLVPNHVLEIPDPNVTIGKACTPFPIEFVVRGYLAGHAWRQYKAGYRTLCGNHLPDGLRQNDAFPHPILTPTTKATEGHDQDISREEILKQKILDANTFDALAAFSLDLFKRGTEIAENNGLILVDTKYEFGRDIDGNITLIDEIHTPDSSRYFYSDSYQDLLERDQPQRQLSKEFVREWLMAHGFQGLSGQVLPDLPDAFRIDISMRYIELYEQMTGQAFDPDLSTNPVSRVKQSINTSELLAPVL